MKHREAGLFLLSALLLGILPGQAQQLHPKLTSKEKTLRQLLILPARIEIAKQGMKGGEAMIKESEDVGNAAAAIVSKALVDKGLKVLDNPFTSQALQEDENLKYALADIQKRYDNLAPKIARKPKDITKGRFSLGDEVANLRPGAQADALVFIRGRGTELTSGKKAFGALVGGASKSTLFVNITVVDSHTGDVLYFARATNLPKLFGVVHQEFVRNPEKVLGKPIADALKKLPGAT